MWGLVVMRNMSIILVPLHVMTLLPKHIGTGLQQDGSSACQSQIGTGSEQHLIGGLRAAGSDLSTSKGQGSSAGGRSLGKG